MWYILFFILLSNFKTTFYFSQEETALAGGRVWRCQIVSVLQCLI